MIVVFADSFVFVRGMGLGAREVKALGKSEVSVDKVPTVLDGSPVPGLRITGSTGKPRFVVAFTVEGQSGNAGEQEAVRDEVFAVLTS